MDSSDESEVGGLLYYGKTAVPLHININELGFPQPLTLIKTDNSVSEVIITATVRQKSFKVMDIIFYLMKYHVKLKSFLYT